MNFVCIGFRDLVGTETLETNLLTDGHGRLIIIIIITNLLSCPFSPKNPHSKQPTDSHWLQGRVTALRRQRKTPGELTSSTRGWASASWSPRTRPATFSRQGVITWEKKEEFRHTIFHGGQGREGHTLKAQVKANLDLSQASYHSNQAKQNKTSYRNKPVCVRKVTSVHSETLHGSKEYGLHAHAHL